MSGLSTAAAAQAAGISEAELSALEASGQIGKRPDLSALAWPAGLHAAKLEGIANGWLPAEKDLSVWRELRVFTTAGDGMTVNCYLVWDEVTRDAALFDTGFDARLMLDCIAKNQLVLRHVFHHALALRSCRGAAQNPRSLSESEVAQRFQKCAGGPTQQAE